MNAGRETGLNLDRSGMGLSYRWRARDMAVTRKLSPSPRRWKRRGHWQRSPVQNRFGLERMWLMAPVLQTRKILCVGMNYRDHAIESNMAIPDVSIMLPNAVTGPDSEIMLPQKSTDRTYEAELVAVIGRGGINMRRGDWKQHVPGYAILNVSAPAVQLATSQATLGKNFDAFASMGPAIVTTDEIKALIDWASSCLSTATCRGTRTTGTDFFQAAGPDCVSIFRNFSGACRHNQFGTSCKRGTGADTEATLFMLPQLLSISSCHSVVPECANSLNLRQFSKRILEREFS